MALDELLFPMDVLMEIDGQPIGNDGARTRFNAYEALLALW